jgi:SAM-dependent methyltransferase
VAAKVRRMSNSLLQAGRVRNLYSRAISHPRVYKAQGALLGRDRLEAAMRPVVHRAVDGASTGTVIDVGGGTAEARALWPSGWRYIAIDNDERMAGIQTDSMERITGSAGKVPLPDGVADHVLMSNVSHHLDDRTWSAALTEIRRMLRPDGTLIFVDGVFVSGDIVSRAGWFLDAGRHPRPESRLLADLSSVFDVVSVDRLRLLHHCMVVQARQKR